METHLYENYNKYNSKGYHKHDRRIMKIIQEEQTYKLFRDINMSLRGSYYKPLIEVAYITEVG